MSKQKKTVLLLLSALCFACGASMVKARIKSLPSPVKPARAQVLPAPPCLTHSPRPNYYESSCADSTSTLIWAIRATSTPPEVAPRARSSEMPVKKTVVGYRFKGWDESLARLVRDEASLQGLTPAQTDLALAIVDCESTWNPQAININKTGSKDHGLWQFNDYWHKDMPRDCMYDPACSTKKAISMIKAGYAHRWMCYAIVTR